MASAFQPFHGRPPAGASDLNSSTRPPQSSKPAPVDLNALQNASRILLDQLAKDAQVIPDLGETLTGGVGQASGNYSIFPDDIRVPYQKRRFIGIPDGLFQYYDTANTTSHMGIFTEIERVWISIDHKLFLWDYKDGQEIASFLDQPDIITNVALVKPKPGLFVDEITSLLVICTPVSILLIGVSLVDEEGYATKQLRLYATDFSLQVDVEMTSVVGTEDGRIFMCGIQDGNLYELHYQSTESWFAKRIQLINHSVGGVQSLLPRFASNTNEESTTFAVYDEPRKLLYTLTGKNTINIYKPGGDKVLQHLQSISNIYKAAQDKAPGSPALTPQNFSLISLQVVTQADSRSGVQFFVTTANGVRIFFGPTPSYGYSYGTGGGTRPLGLIHVRLPPTTLIHPDEQASLHRAPTGLYGAPTAPTQQNTRPYALSNLENVSYINGLTIATQSGESDDCVVCLAPDLTHIGNLGQLNPPQRQPQAPQYSTGASPYSNPTSTSTRPPLYEYATVLNIPGRTWAVAQVAPQPPPSPPNTPSPSPINELATQFSEPATQFLLMTNMGLTFLIKRRAVDYLKAVLEEIQTDTNLQPMIEFRDSFGRDQTCAMLLGLASGNTFLDGIESPSPSVSVVSPEICAVAKQAFYDFGERPIWAERGALYGATAENKGTAIYSGRREGLAIYFSRLVRPIWKAKIVKVGPSGMHELGVSPKLLLHTQQNLFALKDFLDKNPHLFHSAASLEAGNRTAAGDQEAWKAEHTSITELQALLTRSIEALSFMMLLNDYRLGDLVQHCDAESRTLIESQTFEDLITTHNGMNVSRALVNVVIDQQIGQQISVDTISEVLQQRCGSFCSTDDVMLYKAKESIRKAAETRNPTERQNCLAEALRLFTKGARILEFEKLREVIGDFQQLDFAKGAVTLPLACAQAQDPDNVGLEYWYQNPLSTSTDPRKELTDRRLQNYDLILDSLSVFEKKSEAAKELATDGSSYSDDATSVVVHAYELAFASTDEMFHSTLYDWIIESGGADWLLEQRPQFLEAHLRRDPPTVDKYQLLWQFYVKNGQPLRAAEVLGALAESAEFQLTLEKRVEYLTLAVANAKSHPISAGGRHETAIAFLTDLEEKLEVAQVQLEVFTVLAPHMDDAPEVREHIKRLSERLFTMTEIFQDYAVPFDLAQIKLLCLHVSEHRDEGIVRPIWNQIFEETLSISQDVNVQRDNLFKTVSRLGQRFYPSESAFPLRFVSQLLVRFVLANKSDVQSGWVSNLLVECNVPYVEIWEVLHNMYESQVPPFNEQSNVQALSAEIAILITDWLNEALRPQSSISRAEFPVGRIDLAIDQYLSELEPSRTETRSAYENIKRQLRRYW